MKFILFLLALTTFARADYALKDGDTVVFLGDSITGARGYTKLVEHYTLMRFPERKVRFVNAGQGGDTMNGCLARLDRDVFSKGATVVTAAFGINDIGWGTKADEEHKQLYLNGIRTLITRCREKNVRPVICSPAITAEAPETAEKSYLQTMADEGLALAKSLGADTIDLHRGMREIQHRVIDGNRNTKPEDHVSLHVKDGIHLAELGQLAMGYAMIKGLGAPSEVSAVEIDAATSRATSADCDVSDLSATEAGISFTRLDKGLPLNLGSLWQLQHRWIPFPDGLNGYRLTVKNLSAGEYELKAGGRGLGKASADQLAKGLNLASMTADGWHPGGPWHVQSWMVQQLVESRDDLWAAGSSLDQYAGPDLAAVKQAIIRQDDAMVELQRLTAKPRPYRIEISRLKP